MKYKALGLVALSSLFFVACKEKPKSEEQASSVAPEKSAVDETVKKEEPKEEKKDKMVLSLDERAAKLGFAKHLPADTEVLLSVYDAKGSFERMKSLEMISFIMDQGMKARKEFELDSDEMIEEEMEFEQNGDLGADEMADEEMAAMQEGPGAWTLLGQEVTVAFGATSGTQVGHMLKLNERSSYYQFQLLGRAIQSLAKNGNLDEFVETMAGVSDKSMTMLLEDPESGIDLIDEANMPPMYFAFRAKEGELDQAAQMVSSSMMFFGMAGEMAAPVEFETGGAKFTGYKLIGAKFAEMMAASREGIEEEGIKPETFDALMAAIAKKNMIFTTGTIGDYVVFMIGSDEKQMKLAANPAESLAANEKIKFVDEFGDKPFMTVSYGDKDSLKTMIDQAGGLSSMALGLRSGISGGEMRDIEELLQLFAEREKTLISMGSTDTFGLVAYLDQGLKIDSFGGHDKGGIDWSAPTRLAHLGDQADQLLFLNYSSHAAYSKEMRDYLELMAEAAYALAVKFSALEFDDPKFAQVGDYLSMFDTQFRDDMLGLYQAVSGDLMSGLGKESAYLIDMKGAFPAVPGVPQVIVDQAKAPRFTHISPVTDRAKLASAWEKMDKHSVSLMAKISEMSETKIPMQKPISSKEDGMVTWFISMPFFQDNFMPSVTIHDQWFVASTSKVQAVDLVNKAVAGGDAGDGIRFRINFKVLSDYADEMHKLVQKNADAVFPDKAALEEFKKEEANVDRLIKATRQFESMDWNVRKEDGVVRSRIHFKMN